jgi:hypothetical protein
MLLLFKSNKINQKANWVICAATFGKNIQKSRQTKIILEKRGSSK